MKKAFTLAEIMIVLTVIGVITALLLPIAINSSPDENVMKFKKGNNTLGTVIRELVNSDKYYANGDLGIRANGTIIDGSNDEDITYFCQSFADIVSTKKLSCSENSTHTSEAYARIDIGRYFDRETDDNIETEKLRVDEVCKNSQAIIGAEIITIDNIVYFQTTPRITFGMNWSEELEMNDEYDGAVGCNENHQACLNARLFGPPNNAFHVDFYGNDRVYKVFCMDVDGINKGEDPFGYGIRADGKIFTGARADEWMNKSMQKGD